MVVRATEVDSERLWAVLIRPRTAELVINSLQLMASVTFTCVVVGIATAWMLTRLVLPFRAFFVVLAAMPLAIPSYVAAFGWIAMNPGINGFFWSWLILSAVSVPLVTLPVLAAFSNADYAMVETARSFGRSPVRAWFTGMLPQVAPAAAAGGLLVALYSLSEYGAVAAFRMPVFTFAIIDNFRTFFGINAALTLSLVLVFFAIILVILERLVRIRGERWRVGSGARIPPTKINAGFMTPVAIAAMLVVPIISFGVPVYAMFTQFNPSDRYPFVFSDWLNATTSTLWIAGAGALLALAICLPIGLLAARHRGPVVATIESAGFTGHALPGVVVGLAFVFFALRAAPGLYHTVYILIFAYAVMFLPKAIGAARTSIEQAPPTLTDTARSLGRNPLSAWWSTTGRIATPGITAGTLLVMLTIMKELPATLFLRPAEFDTLATKMWGLMSLQAYGTAAPYALTLMVLAAVPTLLLSRYSARQDS